MHVTQIADSAFGYSSVFTDRGERRVLRVIETLGVRYAGKGASGGPDVLVVLPKRLEDKLKGRLPGNVGTLHFGKLRGQDAFKGVAALLVVSRPLPWPSAAEDTALRNQNCCRLRFNPEKPPYSSTTSPVHPVTSP